MQRPGGGPVRWQQVPDGMRDLLPDAAERRRAVEAAVQEATRRWGYREVRTPTLEYLDTFRRGEGTLAEDGLFKIVDRGGEILALRPEMTVPIARLAATRLLPGSPRPLRLSYVASVFRGQEAGRGWLREFTQAGVELLGDGRPDADAEVIALAVECLRRAGVAEPLLHVGDLGFLADALGDGDQEVIRRRLDRKEFAALESDVSDPEMARFLRTLPHLRGPDAVDRAARYARSARGVAALERLSSVLEHLAEYDVAASVTVDLSIIRDFTYYGGVVFEAYGAGVGYPILGGGRYDGLLGRFGTDCPATGFALGIEQVLAVVPPQAPAPMDAVVAAAEPWRAAAVAVARGLRESGRSVIVCGERSASATVAFAAALGARAAVWIEGDTARIIDADGGRERIIARSDVLSEFGERSRVVSWTH